MNLVFDIGNTETVLGLFEDHGLVDHWRISTRHDRTVDELGLLVRSLLRESGYQADVVRSVAIASVVPPLTASFAAAAQQHVGADVVTIDASTPLPIRLDVEEPHSVGADRIVNTLAAMHLYRRDTIAVDLGTATTFDCITADGTFLGGVIAPGLYTGAESLVRRTAVLPRVELQPPPLTIGRRTDLAIRSGVVFGAIDAIDGIVRRIKREWSPGALVVATGGLAAVIAPHCTTVDRVEPFMTLYGLDIALRHVQAGNRPAPEPRNPRPGRRRRS
ncbi:MAG TPA: type III pantothenate kinase [Longimicrobiales bacterium]|nr:type III pantothenate kinase [Longimicrobiales bacterium]